MLLCGCSKILPTKSTSISAVRLSYNTYARIFALCGGADTPKQDACYCEFYWAVNFVVHDTVTIPYLTAVRNTELGTRKLAVGFSCSHHQKHARCLKKKACHYCSYPAVYTPYICLCMPVAPVAQRYHVTSDTLGREFDPGKQDFSH